MCGHFCYFHFIYFFYNIQYKCQIILFVLHWFCLFFPLTFQTFVLKYIIFFSNELSRVPQNRGLGVSSKSHSVPSYNISSLTEDVKVRWLTFSWSAFCVYLGKNNINCNKTINFHCLYFVLHPVNFFDFKYSVFLLSWTWT